jgi:hypothetical protein
MRKVKRVAKFVWLYLSSMFLPTALVTARVEKALKEFDEEQRRDEQARLKVVRDS